MMNDLGAFAQIGGIFSGWLEIGSVGEHLKNFGKLWKS